MVPADGARVSTAAAPGLMPVRSRLDNGLVVIAKETTSAPAVTLNVMCSAGSVHDPVGAPGVAHLTARLLDRGTQGRSAGEIADELDERGVSLSIRTSRHTTAISVDCLVHDFEALIALVADILCRPAFPDDQLSLRRGETLTRLKQDADNPASRAGEALFTMLYGAAHPYGWRMRGTPESVQRIDREDLVHFHRLHFVPSRVSLAIVGNIPPGKALDAAGRAFADWDAPESLDLDLPPPPVRGARDVAVIPMLSKAQADIAYGFVSIGRLDPEYYAWWIMNTVLGQYGIGGRIGDDVRESQGLAYYAYSAFDPHLIPGPLIVRAGVDGANVDRAIAAIDAQIDKLAHEGPAAAEVADTKRFLIGSLPRTLETNGGIAFFLQTAEHFRLGLDYDVRLPSIIEDVTLDAVHAAASRLSPQRAAVAVAGPYDGGLGR
jgi:zinc protease